MWTWWVRRSSSAPRESEFIDAVSWNLRRGGAVVAVVGDGIREDMLGLAELLQTHAGLRFVFALVEGHLVVRPPPSVSSAYLGSATSA